MDETTETAPPNAPFASPPVRFPPPAGSRGCPPGMLRCRRAIGAAIDRRPPRPWRAIVPGLVNEPAAADLRIEAIKRNKRTARIDSENTPNAEPHAASPERDPEAAPVTVQVAESRASGPVRNEAASPQAGEKKSAATPTTKLPAITTVG